MEVNITARIKKAEEQKFDLLQRRAAFVAHEDTQIEKLAREEVAFEQDRSNKVDAVRAKNDAGKTEAGTIYRDCLEKYRAADVKVRAYKKLREFMSTADTKISTALRFAVNVVAEAMKSLFSIQSFVLDGSFSGSSSRVAARVKCKVGGYDYDFSFSVDLGDIVSFFSEMWEKIKSVITNVGNDLLKFAKEGAEAIKKFCIEAAKEFKEAADATADEFMRQLAAHEDEVKGYLDAIDKDLLQPFKSAEDQLLRDVREGLGQMEKDVNRALREVGDMIFHSELQPKDGLDLTGGLGSDIITTFGRSFGISSSMADEKRKAAQTDMEAEALKSRMKGRLRKDNKPATTLDILSRESQALKQSRQAVQEKMGRLQELYRAMTIGEDKMKDLEFGLWKMEKQVEIREKLLDIQGYLLELEVVSGAGSAGDVNRADAKMSIAEDIIRKTVEEVKERTEEEEIRRKKVQVREMKNRNPGRDQIERVEKELKDLEMKRVMDAVQAKFDASRH